jgi:uncharacterized protein (TIGR03437 family)
MRIPRRYLRGLARLICLTAVLPQTHALSGSEYTITTFAGSSNNGDGGPATEAFVSILEGVCADSAGNVYLADADDNRIRLINPAGIISTYAGNGVAGYGGDGGPATQAFLSAPYGIRIDTSGNLFIADLGNGAIRRVATDGTISTVASNLSAPRNLAFGTDGTLYVSEFGANRVSRVNADGSTTVIAGNGTAGFSGDGGPATGAQLNSPAGIIFDFSGSLYIADSANARVRRVTTDGSISTVAGEGAPGGAGTLVISEPTGVASDPEGDVYVTNSGSPRTFRMDPDGTLRQLPGDGRDLFFSAAGNLLLAGEQHLETLFPNGTLTSVLEQSTYTFGDGGPANEARFESVTSVAVDPQGQVTIADAAFRRVRQVSMNGVINALPVSDYVANPQSLAFNPAGQLFIADGSSIIAANGASEPAVVAANLTNPDGLSFFGTGTLYFSNANAIFAVDTDTGAAPSAVAGPFGAPAGLTTDSAGDIYVADAGTNRVIEVFADGTESVIAGTGTSGYAGDMGYATAALLAAPAGVWIDPTGVLWIADTGNSVIRTVDTSGIIRTVAGTGSSGFSGDGGPAAGALLSSPTAVAEDGNGNIYVADSGNRRVRELTLGTGGGQNLNGIVTVTHSATFQTGAIAGGEIVALFGLAIGPAASLGAQLDSKGNVSTTLGATSVLFNGIAAPLYYAGPNQINAEAPVEIAGNISTLVQVQSGTKTIASGLVDIAPYEPGLFAAGTSSGHTFAAALNQDLSVNGANRPAPKGSVIVLYGTGFGSTQPLDKTGVPAAPPLGIPLGYVTVSINGESAAVLFVGDAPDFCGLTQINVQIPTDVTGQAQVVVNEGALSSPTGVYIWVQ